MAEVAEGLKADGAPVAQSSQSGVTRRRGQAVDYNQKAKQLAQRCIDDARKNQARLDRDRQDWQNHLMYRGGQSQWMVYDRGNNTFVPRGNDPDQGGLPDWVPRPATNIFGVKIDQIVSLLNRAQPAKLFSPATTDEKDRAAAQVAEDADPVLIKECGYDVDRTQLNKLATLTNGAAYVLHYDTDERYGMHGIPVLRCPNPECEAITMPMELDDAGDVCPVCGETSADDFQPEIQNDGTPLEIKYPRGKIIGTVIPSFEYSIPTTARTTDTTRLPWVLTHSGQSKEDIIARWGKKGEAAVSKTGGKKIGGLQRAYARAMRQLSSPARANAPAAAAGGSSASEDYVVYILHHDPIDDGEYYFPDGLLLVMIEDQIMESGPLPVVNDEGQAVKSVLIRSYMQSPGTAFGKPPADDMVPLQISRNLVDSLIQLILMHDAAPRSWVPLSVTLENDPTGRPGEILFYRSTVPGEAPKTDNGINPPDGLYKYLEIIDSKFEEISKLNSVLAGQRPEGDPTLGEVQILQEQGMSSFNEPLTELVAFEEKLTRMLFWIAKRSGWAPRFRQVHGDDGTWDVKEFTAADLDGRIHIVMDPQSAWPKSPTMRLARLAQGFKMGALPPPAQDPEVQTKVLLELELIDFKPSIDRDRKQIGRELDRWREAKDPADILPPDPKRQNLALHLHFKQDFLKTEDFETLMTVNKPVADAMIAHVDQLQQMVMANATPKAEPPKVSIAAKTTMSDQDIRKIVEQAYGLPPTPPPPEPVKEGAAPAGPPQPTGAELNHAISTGTIAPAPQGAPPQPPPPNAVGGMVSSGVIAPAAAAAPPPEAPEPTGPSIDDMLARGIVIPVPAQPPQPPAMPGQPGSPNAIQ